MSSYLHLRSSKPYVVISHARCNDGFGSIVSAFNALGENAEYYVMGTHQPWPELLTLIEGKVVFMIDFCYNAGSYNEDGVYHAGFLDQIIEKSASFILLDHHESAFEGLKKSIFFSDVRTQWGDGGTWEGHAPLIQEGQKLVSLFVSSKQDQKSGAGLSWRYFHGDKLPKLIRAIEDSDLYVFNQEDTRAIITAFSGLDFTFRDSIKNGPVKIDDLHRGLNFLLEMEDDKKWEELRERGNYYLEHKQMIAEQIANNAYDLLISKNGNKWMGQGVNCISVFTSDVGETIMNKKVLFKDFALMFQINPDCVKISLRSNDKNADVRELAELFGGGGHRNAAAFTMEHQEFLNCYKSWIEAAKKHREHLAKKFSKIKKAY